MGDWEGCSHARSKVQKSETLTIKHAPHLKEPQVVQQVGMVEFGAIFKNAYGPYGHIMALSFRRIADLFPIRVCRFFRKDMVPQRSFPVRTLSLDFQVDGRAAS